MRTFAVEPKNPTFLPVAASKPHAVRAAPSHRAALLPEFDFRRLPILPPVRVQPKLTIGAAGDAHEREADSIADRVMRMPESTVQRTCACGGTCDACNGAHETQHSVRREPLHASAAPVSEGAGVEAPPIVHDMLRAPGESLDAATRAFFEPRLGHDFSAVRVHTGAAAAGAAQAIGAQAFTVGRDVGFGAGRYAPSSGEGRRLLAHELAHAVQQGAGRHRVQRKPTKAATTDPDPLCVGFKLDAATAAVDVAAKEVKAAKAEEEVEKRHVLVRLIKPILRCGAAADIEATNKSLATALGGTPAAAIWSEANSAFGGYTGMYPGFAGDMKTRLGKLGVSDRVAYETYTVPDYAHDKPAKKSAIQKGADKAAADLGRIDILYFRGHQFAQYKAPGVFTGSDFGEAIDLRYINQAGGFANVKMVISTSCATLCREAFELFHGLFPNAILLGFRKSAPLNGAKLRDLFEAKIKDLKRPLLLDQVVDLSAIVSVWKAAVQSEFAGSSSLPGYYDGTLNYFDGKAWQTIAASSKANDCHIKGDETAVFPAP